MPVARSRANFPALLAAAMPKSAAFARIHRDVMQIAAAIPAGKVATFADIGAFLDLVPWYRVVPTPTTARTVKR